MPITVATTRQALADRYAQLAAFGSVHNADPGTTGTGEITGGTYARKALAWTPQTGGVTGSTATFDIPAAGLADWGGIWSLVTGGTFIDKVDIVNQSFASAGQLTITYTYTQS